jgi:hypothetical protein
MQREVQHKVRGQMRTEIQYYHRIVAVVLVSCQRRLNIPQFPPVEKSPLSPVEISPGAERRL